MYSHRFTASQFTRLTLAHIDRILANRHLVVYNVAHRNGQVIGDYSQILSKLRLCLEFRPLSVQPNKP